MSDFTDYSERYNCLRMERHDGVLHARLHTDEQTLSLHAGAGVVADSDPAAEAAETDVKLATVLDSLVPGGSAHLR